MKTETIRMEEGSIGANTRSPIVLECRAFDHVRKLVYKDLSGEIISQYVHNNTVKAYFVELNEALRVINFNHKLIHSYQISCNNLVVGDNYYPYPVELGYLKEGLK